MSSDVGLDETDDRILVKMLWETRVYVMQNFKEFTELAKVLTSWAPLSIYTPKAIQEVGSSEDKSLSFVHVIYLMYFTKLDTHWTKCRFLKTS